MDDAPPAYGEEPVVGHSRISAQTPFPSNCMKARPPLKLRRQNASIKERYILQLHEIERLNEPDFHLETSNGFIDTEIWLEGVPLKGRVIIVDLKCSNSGIRAAFHKTDDKQHLAATLRTSNARIETCLPNDFKGILVIATTNASYELRPQLKAVAVQIANRNPADKHAVTFEIAGGLGFDSCELRTSNGQICVGLERDETDKKEENCRIM